MLSPASRHGSWYPDRQLRLFDRRRAHWGGHDPHDKVLLDPPHDRRPGRLGGDLVHYSYRDLADHLDTIERFTTIAARGLHERGRRARLSDLVLRPLVSFTRFYIIERGFLEGWRGLALAFLAAHYVRLKYLRLMVLQRGSRPCDPARPSR